MPNLVLIAQYSSFLWLKDWWVVKISQLSYVDLALSHGLERFNMIASLNIRQNWLWHRQTWSLSISSSHLDANLVVVMTKMLGYTLHFMFFMVCLLLSIIENPESSSLSVNVYNHKWKSNPNVHLYGAELALIWLWVFCIACYSNGYRDTK